MASVDPDKMIRILTGKFGFEQQEGVHKFFALWLDGQVHAKTMVSHSSKSEIGDILLGKMARQMHIKRTELIEMVDCSKDCTWYYDKLRQMR